MSKINLSPPPTQIEEFGSEWRTWLYLVYKKLTTREFYIHLNVSTGLSPSLDPMADGLIGIVPVVLADDTKDESRNLSIHMPMNWVVGSDLTLHLHLINTTAQTGVKDVVTELTYLFVADGEAADGSGTTLSNTYSLPTGVAANILHEGPTFTLPGTSISKDDKLFLKILRRGSSASDTVVGDVGYDGIHIEYTGYINHE